VANGNDRRAFLRQVGAFSIVALGGLATVTDVSLAQAVAPARRPFPAPAVSDDLLGPRSAAAADDCSAGCNTGDCAKGSGTCPAGNKHEC
jgi:hypothetical protein